LNANIEYAPGFDIKGGFNFSVDSIKIVGSEDIIKNIESVSTKELKLNKVNNLINEDVELEEIKDIEIFPKRINVKADVKRFTEGTIEVPVTITGQPNDIKINYFPKTVTISYYVDLESYNTISVSDFMVECNYNQASEDQTYLVPKITKSPNFIKRINIKQKRVDFIKL